MKSADYWIEKLNLKSHPEGGYYAETYRSAEAISADCLPARYDGERNYLTSIYFLMTSESPSYIHKLKTDELWHFYAGSPARIVIFDEKKGYRSKLLGPNPDERQSFQAIVPAGVWYGAFPLGDAAYTLVGCDLSPGFDFDDFELGDRDYLLKKFPKYRNLLERLTR